LSPTFPPDQRRKHHGQVLKRNTDAAQCAAEIGGVAMKLTPTTPAYTKPTTARFSLGQTTALDIGRNLHGAYVAVADAMAKASKLSNRTDFAALTGDLERLHADLSDIQDTVEWLRRGNQTAPRATKTGGRRHG